MRLSMTIALLALFVLVDSGRGQEKTQEKKVTDTWFKGYFGHEQLFLHLARGKVLDVFDANQLLLSLGANHGARKGWELEVYRLEPEPLYIGRVELVEVGAKHSVGRFRGRNKVHENDLASWLSPIAPKAQGPPRLPGTLEPGGAIIDLTRPEKAK
jgi:hypothetical protein